jgi:hypothetical protein
MPTSRYAIHNGKHFDGQPQGIGIQTRNKLIRRLIEEVRRLRHQKLRT